MPLHALTDAVNTLSNLIQQLKHARRFEESKVGELEAIENLMEETVETMRGLLTMLQEAQSRGSVDELLDKDETS
jgi:hypothetical protein